MDKPVRTKWWVRTRPVVPPPEDLSALKKAELVELAEQQGVDSEGTKAEIVERLSDG